MYDVKHRLVDQFKDKPKINDLINALIDYDIEDANNDLLTKRGLNTAIGKQLDGIGEIVGLARPKEPLNQDDAFGFYEDTSASTFGNNNDLSIGSYLYQLNPPLVVPINDDKYRLAIKGKIFQNHTNMTVDETLNILAIIFQVKIRYFLPSNLSPMYEIGKSLAPYEELLLESFPQTIAIGKVTFKSMSEENAFGFLEDDYAKGFGNTSYPEIGGNFSSII